ncbi:MAG: queuine tRNA-ribosyltransferase, partial [bacterium]|nr:queuine tRNA-ribosyltransferase [bacterium]
MLDSRQNFVPILTSEAGSSLTTLNWEEVNTTCAAYYLEPLLIKPGYEFLRTLSHMGHYLNWNGSLILNASSFTANKEGVFTLISPFDGSKIKLDYAQLIKLINHLQPDVVVLPSKTLRDFPQIWTDWNASITPFISVDDVHMNTVSIPYGVYFVFEEKSSVSIEQLGRWSQV